MEKKLIDIAYDLAKVKYAKKAFTFVQLWKELIKKAKLDEQEQKEAGYIYTTMLQDHRFIFIGNNEWKIREFLTLEQQQELSNALYDFARDNEPINKEKEEEEYTTSFDPDEDEEYDEAKKVALDDSDDDEDEIDNESESSDDEEELDEESDKANEEEE